VKTLQVTEAPSLAVKPNAGWQDEQAARDARQLLEQGREAEAISLLKRTLVAQNQPVASASLLADIYLQQGELNAADVLQNQLVYLPEVTRTKIKAQMAVAKGDQAAAISLLEQQLSDAQSDENYRALLASLYHKTGAYAQSVTSYQRLISSFGEKPSYWLGLALAYDGLAQPKNALQAYLHLRDFPQLQEQVKTYTDQRIAALRSQ
jgi:MSHA biogenesis protein MshN